MAKFETKGQIVSLFVGAGCVGMFLIFLLTVEARNRENKEKIGEEILLTTETRNRDKGNVDDKITLKEKLNSDDETLSGLGYMWFKLKSSLSSLRSQDLEEEGHIRRKREVKYSEDDSVSHSVGTNRGSAMLGEALDGHKVRHIEEKIAHLKVDDQLVKAILDKFCIKDDSNKYDEGGNLTKQVDDILKNSKEDDNHKKNYTEKLISTEDVIGAQMSPIKNEHRDFHQHAMGICSSATEVILVVFITSLINGIVFILIISCLRLYNHKKNVFMDLEDNDALVEY